MIVGHAKFCVQVTGHEQTSGWSKQVSSTMLQGQYEVKFMVDGHWRTAPDWPTVQTQHGQNNVLQVD